MLGISEYQLHNIASCTITPIGGEIANVLGKLSDMILANHEDIRVLRQEIRELKSEINDLKSASHIHYN